MVNGMDTMLSFSLDGALSCSLWAWCKDQRGPVRGTILLGLIGAGAIIARPENGLFAILSPILGALLLRGSDRKADIFRPALACAGFIGIYLVCYRTYFHAWLPLSFYMKSRHPYLGYTGAIRWLPEAYLRKFFLLAGPILVFPLLCLNYRSLRVAVTYLVPIALTFAYLENVTQIMGGNARYYVPFVAPVLVGALWMTDLSLQGDWRRSLFVRRFRIAVLCPVISLSGIAIWSQARTWSQHRLLVAPYAAPKIVVAATSPLPELPWFEVINTLANEIVKPLPPGTLVAASEVGLIGAAAPQVGVIDLAGLNDNDIALRGFSMDRLLDREPVLIWFPHGDYTWQRQAMLCSPGLLRAYTVLGGNAFNYSLAIRRGTPVTGQLDESVVKAFRSLYPGSAMEDYLASSIKCD